MSTLLAETSLAPRERSSPSRAQESPVMELVDYLNQTGIPHAAAGHVQDLPALVRDVYRLDAGKVWVQLGIFRLNSRFRNIAPPTAPDSRDRLRAELEVALASGRVISRKAFLGLHAHAPGIVAADRICRTLHMLNILVEPSAWRELWLDVSLEHVLAVEDDHGSFLEPLLYRCGIEPSQVVLVIPALPLGDPDFSRLRAALSAYRRRGHPLALDVREGRPELLRPALDTLAPEWIYLHNRQLRQTSWPAERHSVLLDGANSVLAGPAA